jgi:hypothetical protein
MAKPENIPRTSYEPGPNAERAPHRSPGTKPVSSFSPPGEFVFSG